jgi:hypothetical protein
MVRQVQCKNVQAVDIGFSGQPVRQSCCLHAAMIVRAPEPTQPRAYIGGDHEFLLHKSPKKTNRTSVLVSTCKSAGLKTLLEGKKGVQLVWVRSCSVLARHGQLQGKASTSVSSRNIQGGPPFERTPEMNLTTLLQTFAFARQVLLYEQF